MNFKEFYTPEEFFLKHKAVKFEWGSIDPNEFLEKHATSKNGTEEKKKYHSDVKIIKQYANKLN